METGFFRVVLLFVLIYLRSFVFPLGVRRFPCLLGVNSSEVEAHFACFDLLLCRTMRALGSKLHGKCPQVLGFSSWLPLCCLEVPVFMLSISVAGTVPACILAQCLVWLCFAYVSRRRGHLSSGEMVLELLEE